MLEFQEMTFADITGGYSIVQYIFPDVNEEDADYLLSCKTAWPVAGNNICLYIRQLREYKQSKYNQPFMKLCEFCNNVASYGTLCKECNDHWSV